jgi:hypothetical protein
MAFYKQKHFGKLKVPITEGAGEPATNVVWTSFSTGKEPENHKIRYFSIYNNWLLRWLHRFIYLHPNIYRFVAKLNLAECAKKAGLKKEPVSAKHIGKTFFDDYESHVISLPCYNEDAVNYEIRKKLFDVFQNKMSEEEFMQMNLSAFNSRLERFEKEINKHELLCVHFFILDSLQHIYYYDKNKILWWYNYIASRLEPVIKKIKGRVYMISDHGQKKGMHTSYGFWSSNKGKIKEKSIVNFYRNLL